MTKTEFVREIMDEISATCSLPLFTHEDEIKRITDRAGRWFYRNYEYAVETKYIAIESSSFSKDLFKRERAIQLPDTIVAVTDVKETDKTNILRNYKDPDFNLERMVMENSIMASESESLMYYVTSKMFMENTRGLFLDTIHFDFNINTKKFRFLGEIPSHNIVLTVSEQIQSEALYNDPLFFDYVVAMVKKQVSRILGTFQFDLIGGAQINFNLIQSEGKEEMQRIRDEIDDQDTTDWFIMVN